jgi:hypothetical protein
MSTSILQYLSNYLFLSFIVKNTRCNFSDFCQFFYVDKNRNNLLLKFTAYYQHTSYSKSDMEIHLP